MKAQATNVPRAIGTVSYTHLKIRVLPFLPERRAVNENDYIVLTESLKNTVKAGGLVYGAFVDGRLKGFVSVDGAPFGKERQYADLMYLYVSRDMRGRGIGRRLFETAKEYARKIGTEKFYISAHSAVETQAFYKAVGCVEASEYQKKHVEKEPFDCQLECALNDGAALSVNKKRGNF